MKINILEVQENTAKIEIIQPNGTNFIFHKRLLEINYHELNPVGFTNETFKNETIRREAHMVFCKISSFILTLEFREICGQKQENYTENHNIFKKFKYKKYTNIRALIDFANKD